MLGLAGVAAGTAWAVGGAPLRSAANTLLTAAPVLVIATGVLILFHKLAPRGPLAGPLILIVAGSTVLAFQLSLITSAVIRTVGPALLIVAGVAIALSRSATENPLIAIVTHRWQVFLPRRWEVKGTAARKYVIRSVFAECELDLSKARYPDNTPRITIDITVIGGWIELRMPSEWEVYPGRMDLVRGTRFSGSLTSRDKLPDAEANNELGKNHVMLNVQGWYGRVTTGDYASPPPSSGSPAPGGAEGT